MITFQALKDIMRGRELFLWGARQNGLNLMSRLKAEGLEPAAFLDVAPDLTSVAGKPVFRPGAILSRPRGSFFLILCSSLHGQEMAGRCRAAGLEEGLDFLSVQQLRPIDYQVDVAGACNLRCLSCGRGRHHPQPRAGFMKAADFEKVLARIVAQSPALDILALYTWGEPLLNPELPEIIALCRQRGVAPILSSNLNLKHDFSPVVKARPHLLRISLSGAGPAYEVTHTGGDFSLLLSNLRQLRAWRAEFNPEMAVEVYHHLYRHNLGDDRRRLRDLCADFGFDFRETLAMPLVKFEELLNLNQRRRPPGNDPKVLEELILLPFDQALARAALEKDRPCVLEGTVLIAWDQSIKTCCQVFEPDVSLLPGGFLANEPSAILEARLKRPLCRQCRSMGLHRVPHQYLNPANLAAVLRAEGETV